MSNRFEISCVCGLRFTKTQARTLKKRWGKWVCVCGRSYAPVSGRELRQRIKEAWVCLWPESEPRLITPRLDRLFCEIVNELFAYHCRDCHKAITPEQIAEGNAVEYLLGDGCVDGFLCPACVQAERWLEPLSEIG